MHTSHARAVTFFTILLLAATAAPSRAQSFISPLIGYDYGGNSGCPQISGCEEKRTNFGVAFGSMGRIMGGELEIADAKNFFGTVGDASSSVITIMANTMVVPALGPVHPYVLFGLGLMKARAEFTRADVLTTTNNSLAWDTGGGLIVMVSPHVGFRGDIRHFHSTKAFTIPFVNATLNEKISFGRASAALVFAY